MKKLLLMFFTLLIFASTAFSYPPWNIEKVGEVVTDWFTGVSVSGDYAYATSAYGLVIIDVADKENPVIINRLEINVSTIHPEIRDTLLFICDGYAGSGNSQPLQLSLLRVDEQK